MRVLALTRYGYMSPSSRYRIYQYLPYLRDHGLDVDVAPLLDDTYLVRRYNSAALPLLGTAVSYVRRLGQLLRAKPYDLIWLQKDAWPGLPGNLESMILRMRAPYVVDYDDAVFHFYDQHPSRIVRRLLGRKVDRVMAGASLVIAGNQYLAQRAQAAGAKRIEFLPTVVNLARYPVAAPPDGEFTVGWIGSPATVPFLQRIRGALREFCRDGQSRVVVIGARDLNWADIPHEEIPWTEDTEVRALQQCHVGIMPLANTPWERGKCGLKIVQYMACARPVVASPIGVNQTIITHGVNGLHASTAQEWVRALRQMKADSEMRQRMGEAGRKMVEQCYCLQVTAPRLVQMLCSAA